MTTDKEQGETARDLLVGGIGGTALGVALSPFTHYSLKRQKLRSSAR